MHALVVSTDSDFGTWDAVDSAITHVSHVPSPRCGVIVALVPKWQVGVAWVQGTRGVERT